MRWKCCGIFSSVVKTVFMTIITFFESIPGKPCVCLFVLILINHCCSVDNMVKYNYSTHLDRDLGCNCYQGLGSLGYLQFDFLLTAFGCVLKWHIWNLTYICKIFLLYFCLFSHFLKMRGWNRILFYQFCFFGGAATQNIDPPVCLFQLASRDLYPIG